jgi:hypothetical protein
MRQNIIFTIIVKIDTWIVTRGDVTYQGIAAGIVEINSMTFVPAGDIACKNVIAAFVV